MQTHKQTDRSVQVQHLVVQLPEMTTAYDWSAGRYYGLHTQLKQRLTGDNTERYMKTQADVHAKSRQEAYSSCHIDMSIALLTSSGRE